MIVYRYECVQLFELNKQKYYYWNVSISEHCCHHCDGTIYKAGTEVETIVETDECGTIKKSICRKKDGGIQIINQKYEFSIFPVYFINHILRYSRYRNRFYIHILLQ